jgi:alkanesulfonate monooxygenase SsuD/methylene tetrahydromethanopterin reductase-like flavin-dependent oxidoreductase (luciferase family)
MWIPGVLSPETVRWCAEHRYPYIGLGTALGPTCDLWDIYADTAAQQGYQAGPENFGYLIPTFLAETEEKAQELGRYFAFGGGQNAFSRPEHTLPPGYNSKAAIRRLAHQPRGSWLGVNRDKLMQAHGPSNPEQVNYDEVRQKLYQGYLRAQENLQTMVGTPKTVIPKIKTLLQVLRPGIFIFFSVQGPVSNADRLTSIRLMAEEVVPAIREYAREIDLPDPYERQPGSAALPAETQRLPVVDREPLAALNLI